MQTHICTQYENFETELLAKWPSCENCDSVHWQPQQSSVQVCEPETGIEEDGFNAQALSVCKGKYNCGNLCPHSCETWPRTSLMSILSLAPPFPQQQGCSGIYSPLLHQAACHAKRLARDVSTLLEGEGGLMMIALEGLCFTASYSGLLSAPLHVYYSCHKDHSITRHGTE